ncbi:3-deoxy-manno-octulosonate cytidylyltransferase [Arcobacter sp.]|uniref:3-deoxy-manno-octulosonate cytidylyltransferase n=1 Tax=Arcobacter sp. TaxID=1872629 RepID=UPI003C72DD26
MPGKKILGVIPARYKSSRFEGKPLALINNIPMIKRTYTQAKKSSKLTDLIVATDDIKIENYCKEENIPTIMTSDLCLTGTDRLAEVAKQLDYDLYVNIQGDEPIIDPLAIDQIVNLYLTNKDYMVYNLYKIITDMKQINRNTIIKVIVNEKDETMYMSRLPIPYSNTKLDSTFKQQIPVYGFTRKALSIFNAQVKTINEQYEDIELLRFLDLGYKIKMIETFVDSISVDVPEDIIKVENFLNRNL